MRTRSTAAVLSFAALAGCASAPPPDLARVVAAPPTCSQLAALRAAAEEGRLDAMEEERNAWKAVVPFVAAARFAQGRADLIVAEERLAYAEAEYRRMGCARKEG
jgi:hypothetical protein